MAADLMAPEADRPTTLVRPRRRLLRLHLLLLVPALALLVAILLVPLFQSLVNSFGDPEWTLQHYRNLFTDGVTLRVLGRTVVTSVVVTALAFLCGYPYAYVMTRVSPGMRGLMLVLVLVPFWTSVMARNFAWIQILQRGGPVDSFFGMFGRDLVFYGTIVGVVISMTQVLLPFMVLPLYSSLGGIDRRLLLAARGLGSHPAKAFWKVYWPLSRSGVVAGLILVFTLALGFYVTPALIGSPQESMVAQLLAQRTTQLLDFAGAGALGMLVLVATLVLVAWANRVGGSVSAVGIVPTTADKSTKEKS